MTQDIRRLDTGADRDDGTPAGLAAGAPACYSAALPSQTLGERIRAHRLVAGLSIEETARRAGIVASYYREIERGRKTPSMRVLRLLAVALNLSPAELLEGPHPLPGLAALDPRRTVLQRLVERSAQLDAASLRSLLDYAGYLSHVRAMARRPRGATSAPTLSVPLFPDDTRDGS